MTKKRLEGFQVNIVYIVGDQARVGRAGIVKSLDSATEQRPAGIYLALRPAAVRAGDYGAIRLVGPVVSAAVAKALRVSALALGARLAAPDRRAVIAVDAGKTSPGLSSGVRNGAFAPATSKLRNGQGTGKPDSWYRNPGSVAGGDRSQLSLPG
jgi:hypothetical protein